MQYPRLDSPAFIHVPENSVSFFPSIHSRSISSSIDLQLKQPSSTQVTIIHSSSDLEVESLETALPRHILLQRQHPLLITCRISRVAAQLPIQELIRVIRLEALVENTQTLAILGNFLPVTLNILQILGEVGVRALVYLPVDDGCHLGLDIDVCLVCFGWGGDDMVGGALDSFHELLDLVGVLGHECVVGCER